MNAKDELLENLKVLNFTSKDIICAQISESNCDVDDVDDVCKTYNLKQNFTENDFSDFLKLLDFNYDDGFGSQELFGCVWFKDNTWLERAEYDGSEWWIHRASPNIPEELKTCV